MQGADCEDAGGGCQETHLDERSPGRPLGEQDCRREELVALEFDSFLMIILSILDKAVHANETGAVNMAF